MEVRTVAEEDVDAMQAQMEIEGARRVRSRTPRSSSFGASTSKDYVLDVSRPRLVALHSSATGMLSPLFPSSPSPAKRSAPSLPATGLSGVPQLEQTAFNSDTPTHVNGKTKQFGVESDSKALEFSKRSVVVASCFKRWRDRATDQAAWIEACRRSDAYSQKVQRQKMSETPPPTKRQRMSSEGSTPSTYKQRRVKKRVVDSHKPRTDEELAHRFEQVQAQPYLLPDERVALSFLLFSSEPRGART